jgi:hypothetical protein
MSGGVLSFRQNSPCSLGEVIPELLGITASLKFLADLEKVRESLAYGPDFRETDTVIVRQKEKSS